MNFANMMNDPEQMARLMAAASMMTNSGPSTRPIGIGEVIGGGMSAYLGTKNAMTQQQAEAEEREQAQQYRGVQMQGIQQQQEAAKAALARSMEVQQALKNRKAPRDQMLSTMSGPTLENAATLPQAPQAQQAGNLFQELMAEAEYLHAKGFPDEAIARAKAAQEIKEKFDTNPRVGNDANGNPFTYVLGDQGNKRVLDGVLPREEKKLLNLNNKFQAVNPYEVADGASFEIGRSADNVASVGAQIRGQNLTHAQANAPIFSADLGGFVSRPNQQNPQGGFTPLAGAPNKGPKMTEDQAKATGWLAQAETAWKNMRAVGLDANGKPTAAAIPGFNDGLAAIPSFGATDAIANSLRSPERQKFMHGASSLSEALLRAATGAGVNIDEARQKVRELTPVFGDDEATIAQKMAAIPMYIDTLRVRAGPGAALAQGVIERNAPPRQPQQPARKSAIPGQVVNGYRFKGGDPSQQSNWEKI